ncbi:Serine/threonine protein kinase [Pseudomonas syringae pv. actinidiae]|uniref:Serine/threonine protein kinase n=1 Tax=Pseudomonas syringae pv. actinidiae TaxID=103796 RepID=A0A2V0QUZ9_PSESF|nr:Serine/threonine protein kinase [Pseudomonas syringae pv. actinidiae]
MGVVGPDHLCDRAAYLLGGLLHALHNVTAIPLATRCRNERQIQHANLVVPEISDQRANGRAELFNHVVHGVRKVLPQPQILHAKLLCHGTISSKSSASRPAALISTRGAYACSRCDHQWRHSLKIGRKMNQPSSTSIRKIPSNLKNRW